MPKTGFFGQKPVSVVFRQIPSKLTLTKMTLFIYGRSDAARRANSEYHLSFSSKRNMKA